MTVYVIIDVKQFIMLLNLNSNKICNKFKIQLVIKIRYNMKANSDKIGNQVKKNF